MVVRVFAWGVAVAACGACGEAADRRHPRMTWVTPLHTFRCGACGTTVSALQTVACVERVMRLHAEVCRGFAPPNHEAVGVGNGASRATEAGFTPGESPRVATDARSGRGE